MNQKELMEGLTQCKTNLVVYLHPSKAKCVHEAIHRELSNLLFTYNETFDGVVLAYDPKNPIKLAKILPGIRPYFGVKLKATLLLFNPKPDMLLEGEVVKVTEYSIHAVVFGFSSATVIDEDFRGRFKYKNKNGNELYVSRSHKKHKIKVGTILRFLVKSFDEEILHISGSLDADRTGNASWLDKNVDKWSQADSTTKKRKHREGEEEEKPESEMINEEALSVKIDEQIKKSKRKGEKKIVEV